jgi:diketogulonate reductase-like aldo/keto reductase
MLDGRAIPQLGLGVSPFLSPVTSTASHPESQVYEMTNDEAYRAVKWALDAGYRHIDTAEWSVPRFPSSHYDR